MTAAWSAGTRSTWRSCSRAWSDGAAGGGEHPLCGRGRRRPCGDSLRDVRAGGAGRGLSGAEAGFASAGEPMLPLSRRPEGCGEIRSRYLKHHPRGMCVGSRERRFLVSFGCRYYRWIGNVRDRRVYFLAGTDFE